MVYQGNSKLGEYFSSRKEKGLSGLPVLSVTMNDGLVNRDDLNRKCESSLPPEKHLLVRRGDIAYNMMRMWQGASGRAEDDGIVSPAYVVLAPRDNIDSMYASYLFKSPKMIYLLWAYSYGITGDRLRLYFPDFKIVPVSIPPLEVQKKIARILFTWDKAIECVNKRIANGKRLFSVVRQKLVTGEERLVGFTKEWESYRLQDLGETFTGLSGKTKEDFGSGKPYIPYMNIFSNGKICLDNFDLVNIGAGEKQNAVQYGDIFFTTSSEVPEEVGMASVFLDNVSELYLNSFCFGFRLNDFELLLPDYARFLLRSDNIRRDIASMAQGATRHNLSRKNLLQIVLKLPPKEEQREIATKLSSFEEYLVALNGQLNSLKSQRDALVQKLLTGDDPFSNTTVSQTD